MRRLKTKAYRTKLLSLTLAACFCAPVTLLADEATPYPIAGVHPEQRPEGAPVISQMQKDDAWYENALKGVTAPYPANLSFLEDQGDWYTPFSQPGMTGPYDIRAWHAE